ncbi:MAG: uncharacterized protein QOE17_891 [Gaiellales bacterium]|nr:uncharacterized protein [Gaiellales bacterium]
MPSLRVLPDVVWLHRLAPSALADDTLNGITLASWWSVSRSDTELSIACELDTVPGAEATSGPYRVLIVDGPIEHGTSGVVANVSRPLAEAGISIFAISSFETCSVLTPADRLDETVDALLVAGWSVHS